MRRLLPMSTGFAIQLIQSRLIIDLRPPHGRSGVWPYLINWANVE